MVLKELFATASEYLPSCKGQKSALTIAKRQMDFFLDECIAQVVKKNITENEETKLAKKKEMKRLEGKNLVFERKDLCFTNKIKTFFELFEIHNMTEYCIDSLTNLVNVIQVVNDTAERGIAII